MYSLENSRFLETGIGDRRKKPLLGAAAVVIATFGGERRDCSGQIRGDTGNPIEAFIEPCLVELALRALPGFLFVRCIGL